MLSKFKLFGFLPEHDPAQSLPPRADLNLLDDWGNDLPRLLREPDFREQVRGMRIPHWPDEKVCEETLPELRLYYLRLGFLASGYVNQVGSPPTGTLPRNVAVPLCKACRLLDRPPILSYDGYALYNWRRLDPRGPIALGNLDTLQNFVDLTDERWFILVHVEIEAAGAHVLSAIDQARVAMESNDRDHLNAALADVAASVRQQVETLERIPEGMDPAIYFKTFRPYIRFFENVVYEGVDAVPMNHRGETGAQSSLLPALTAFMKIPHEPTALTDHLADMRRFMPREHRELLEEIEAMPCPRGLADKQVYNDVLEAMAAFREVHYRWALQYIHQRVQDPRGTGGTPYMQWLDQLIVETRAHKIR